MCVLFGKLHLHLRISCVCRFSGHSFVCSFFSLKGDRIHVHKNLAFNMGVVQLLFFFGTGQTQNKVVRSIYEIHNSSIDKIISHLKAIYSFTGDYDFSL